MSITCLSDYFWKELFLKFLHISLFQKLQKPQGLADPRSNELAIFILRDYLLKKKKKYIEELVGVQIKLN